MTYRPRQTHQDLVDEVERSLGATKRGVGRKLSPAFEELSAEVERLLAAARQPTRRERLGLWLMRCPAVPWRRRYSEGRTVVAHRHGLVTGAIVSLGEWLAGY